MTKVPPGWAQLVSLRCEVTVSCVIHASHTTTMSGPWEMVLNAAGLFRELATAQGRWVMMQYEPTDEALPLGVAEWDPPLC
jgi:hypothetical protein